MLKPTNI